MTSVRELILDEVATVLEAVSIAGGFDHDLAGRVQRFRQEGQTFRDPPQLVVTLGQESKELGPNDRFECRMSILVDIVHGDSTETADDAWPIVDAVVTDVERALAEAGQLGGLVYEAAVESVQPFPIEEGQPFIGAQVEFVVHYRHAWNDPREVRN